MLGRLCGFLRLFLDCVPDTLILRHLPVKEVLSWDRLHIILTMVARLTNEYLLLQFVVFIETS